MKKSILLLCSLLSLSAFSAYYPMYCKGPINAIAMSNSVMRLLINKNPVRAINNGKNLSNGSCAWVNRPIGSTEPALIHIDLQDYPATEYETSFDLPYIDYSKVRSNTVQATMLTHCITTPGCVFTLNVTNSNNQYFVHTHENRNIRFFWN